MLADGSAVQVDALTLGAADFNAFVGFDGPYRSDTNADGLIDELYRVNGDAVGFSLTDVDAAIALFSAQPGQSTAEGVALDGAHWLALSAQAGAVDVVGIPDVTLAARSFEV